MNSLMSFKDRIFGKKAVPKITLLDEATREGINKAYIPKFLYKPTHIYNNITKYTLWGEQLRNINLFVKTVKMNLKHGIVKIGNIVQINVDCLHYIKQHHKKEKQEPLKYAKFVKLNSMFLYGKRKLIRVNSVVEFAMQYINQINSKETKTQHIKMEEQRDIQKHFICQLNGENCEKKYIKEITMIAKDVKNMVVNLQHTIQSLSVYAKIHLNHQILLHYVINAISIFTIKSEE